MNDSAARSLHSAYCHKISNIPKPHTPGRMLTGSEMPARVPNSDILLRSSEMFIQAIETAHCSEPTEQDKDNIIRLLSFKIKTCCVFVSPVADFHNECVLVLQRLCVNGCRSYCVAF